ncbi:MAG: hypothetical protein ACRDIX_00295 [Actinomycetota bacterium]
MATTAEPEDNLTRTYFNSMGLPIRTEGPANAAGWPQTRQVWDERGNLLCRRGPAAVEAGLASEDPADETTWKCHAQEGQAYGVDDPLNTVYTMLALRSLVALRFGTTNGG